MICTQMHEVYALCRDFDVKIGRSDLLRIVCDQCSSKEVCPAALIDEFELPVHRDSVETTQMTKNA